MEKNSVIILCAGKETRWKGSVPKQLVDIGGEVLLKRTIRQVKETGYKPLVITNNDKIKLAIHEHGYITPSKCRWTLETLYNVRDQWGSRTVVLLGDTYYTDELLAKIFKEKRTKFYGNDIEIYALNIVDKGKLIDLLERVLLFAERGGGAKLWDLYSYYTCRARKSIGKDFIRVDDETTDFDLLETYQQFIINKLKK